MTSLFDRLQDELDRREESQGADQPSDAASSPAGISPVDLLALPDDLRRLVQRLARLGTATAAEVADDLGVATGEAETLLGRLVEQGMVRIVEPTESPRPGSPEAIGEGPRGLAERLYRVDFGQRPTRELPVDLWAALADRMGS